MISISRRVALLASAGLISGTLAACQTTTSTAPLPPTAMSASGKPAVFAFQTAAMPAIHIGDGGGSIDDLYAYDGKRSPFAGDTIAWQFELKELPKGGAANVAVYSLAPGCETALSLNGQELSDLASVEPAGSGVTTKTQIPLPASGFRLGMNTLQIREHECTSGGWNDSLIEEATVTLTWPEG